jgi:hypothetical protein
MIGARFARTLTAFASLVVALPLALTSTASAASPVLLETLTVPTNGHSVTSRSFLADGVKYTLVAKGTFAISRGEGHNADAEYRFGTIFQDVCATVPHVDIGVSINVASPTTQKKPVSWGAYSTAHKYTTGWVGNGKQIHVNYHDCNYTDNNGTLTLEIFGTSL